MSTTKHLNRANVLNQGRGIPVPLPRPTAPIKSQIECMELENPDPTALSELRTADWTIKFQTFNVVWTPNGMKGHHFLYLERECPTSTPYRQ
jgi:hypothetical protein